MNRFVLLGLIAAATWLWRKHRDVQHGGMSVEEASRLLGVSPRARPDDVNDAYRKLITRVHPDAGGSAALAAQVNEARDVLLGKHK